MTHCHKTVQLDKLFPFRTGYMYELVHILLTFSHKQASYGPTVHARKDCAPIESPALEIGLPGHDVGTTHVCD